MAGLEQEVRAGAGGGPELVAEVVDAGGIAGAVDDVEALCLSVAGGGVRHLG